MSSRLWTLLALAVVLSACERKTPPAAEDAAVPKAPPPESAAAPPASPTPAKPPARKPGLWAQTVSTAGVTQKSLLCVDAAVEKTMGWWDQQPAKHPCVKQTVTRDPDGSWRFQSQCDGGSSGVSTITGVATGDFSTNYRMQAETVTTGASAPHMNGSHKMTLESAWQGPCPADMKPGDLQLSNGMKINMLEMAPR